MIAILSRHPRARTLLLAACGLFAAGGPAFGATGHLAGPAWRLVLVDGCHEGVRPERIAADGSAWRGVAAVDGPPTTHTAATADVVGWGRCPPWPLGPMVLLADGGVIAGRIAAADATAVVVVSPTLGRLTLPAASVRGLRVGTAVGPAPPRVAMGGDGSLLRLANGDRLLGRRLAWHDDAVAVETRFGVATIPLDVLRAVDLADGAQPAARGPAARPSPWLALADGTRIAIDELRPDAAGDDGIDRSRIVLRGGGPGARVTARCATEAIVAVAVDGGRTTVLAALEPVDAEAAHVFGATWPVTSGCTVAGDWPDLRGDTSFTSLGLHAPARVRYRLPRPAARFEATVGIDGSAGPGQGSVVVKVEIAAGAGGRREVFASPVLRGGDPPLAIRAELGAAEEIELVVEPAAAGAVIDRTLWLDPRVIHR